MLKDKNWCTDWFEGDWSFCCKVHDRMYENRRVPRKWADEILYRCVKRKGHPYIALLMYIGVRLFGWLHYK